eukprot:7383440-Prymnesium_polylepis.2
MCGENCRAARVKRVARGETRGAQGLRGARVVRGTCVACASCGVACPSPCDASMLSTKVMSPSFMRSATEWFQ